MRRLASTEELLQLIDSRLRRLSEQQLDESSRLSIPIVATTPGKQWAKILQEDRDEVVCHLGAVTEGVRFPGRGDVVVPHEISRLPPRPERINGWGTERDRSRSGSAQDLPHHGGAGFAELIVVE
ncbi:MAG: hypothetical protein ACO4CZ_12835, partial [Planctomycetota bacterium]